MPNVLFDSGGNTYTGEFNGTFDMTLSSNGVKSVTLHKVMRVAPGRDLIAEGITAPDDATYYDHFE